ncbi:MAG: hypothetical protein J0J06_15155 [Sphingomonas sp.]|uniref:hypothetical protein n=1 Tax=Sphingomonas sp. TaxID=28214 RepID=UPI001AC2B673|nr:hypothetical protein [Sphingomonas sp.]MBN8816770.1 hypothetical protein [Sphingomonas sp.]
MRVVLFALIAAVASPALAQRMPPVLPFAPAGVDYVETVCAGGIDGRHEVVRVLATGQVSKVTRRSPDVQHARASRAEVSRIWRELDLARFERRVVPPQKPYVMDGVDCTLTRRSNGREHSVTLIQQLRDNPKYRDLIRALDDINALGAKASGPRLRPAGTVASPQR